MTKDMIGNLCSLIDISARCEMAISIVTPDFRRRKFNIIINNDGLKNLLLTILMASSLECFITLLRLGKVKIKAVHVHSTCGTEGRR